MKTTARLGLLFGLVGLSPAYIMAQPPAFTVTGTTAAYTTGKVGIGTNAPATRLTVFTRPMSGSVSRSSSTVFVDHKPLVPQEGYGIEHTDGTVRLTTYVGGTALIGTRSNHALQFFTNDNLTGNVTIDTAGRVGIGTDSPVTALEVRNKGIVESSIWSTDERAILGLHSVLKGVSHTWTLENGVFGTPGLFGIFDRTRGRAGLTIDGQGLVSVGELQITGGADLSEKFDVATPARDSTVKEIIPGMVVSIDPSQPGKLCVSTQAYDRRVAGIVSGAGGVNPGMVMGQSGTAADGAHAVALTGRVYCCVDASAAPIEAGDLLTTSDIPGYAMAVTDHTRAQGATIGKAMSNLPKGRGYVLVLVTLQ